MFWENGVQKEKGWIVLRFTWAFGFGEMSLKRPMDSFIPQRADATRVPLVAGAIPAAAAEELKEEELLIPEISLISRCGAMRGPEGIVFSTAPECAIDDQGKKFVIKGIGNEPLIIAELIGYKMAQILRIPVPDFGVGRLKDGAPFFACALLEDVQRDVSIWFRKKQLVNPDAVLRLLALDVWIANNDRNMNNLLGRGVAGQPGRIEVVAIDFEKARVVRSETPIVEIPTLPAKSFWPTGDLGRLCRETMKLDTRVAKEFLKFSPACIKRVVDSCASSVGNFTRQDSVCVVLNKRLERLETLLKEAWS